MLKHSLQKKLENNKEEEVVQVNETIADPAFDVTFKMLFRNDSNKDMLISLLYRLLELTGHKEIEKAEINSNELPVPFFFEEKGEIGITNDLDILCSNKGEQKIALEMQGQKPNIFFRVSRNIWQS